MKNAALLVLGKAAISEDRRLRMYLATPMALGRGYWRER